MVVAGSMSLAVSVRVNGPGGTDSNRKLPSDSEVVLRAGPLAGVRRRRALAIGA
jgi:hypothetical protein